MKVLIAEDDAVSRTILRRAVEKFGHECLVAGDGREAWDIYQASQDIDLVVSDWMMPGIDGPKLCRLIRGDEQGNYTYFIFLTALGDKEHLQIGLEAGADDYLPKPLDRDELQVRLISAARVTSLHRKLAVQNSQLEKMNLRLFEQAREDPLTHLGNRLRLHEDLQDLKGRVDRYGHSLSVLLCDVDFFKRYNDHYGHLAGDEALRRVARTISSQRRSGDTAYRYGGEEFLVILPEQSIKTAGIFAERLRGAVEELGVPHEAREGQKVVTLSVGIATLSPRDPKSADGLLKEADAALYEAKSLGRNQTRSYTPDLK